MGNENSRTAVQHRHARGRGRKVLAHHRQRNRDHGGVERGERGGDTDGTDATTDVVLSRRLRRTHHSVLEAAIAAAMPRLTAPRSLAVSHAFVAGGAISDSERQLAVGGTSTVDAALFAPFSYTALGHLHRPQVVDGSAVLRYSGTPLAYSFSEDHAKSVSIVDMAADGTCTVIDLPVGVGRAVCTVTGPIDELLRASPTVAVRDSFVRAVITDSAGNTGALALVANSGIASSITWPSTLFLTDAGYGFFVNLSTSVQVDGYVTYVIVETEQATTATG